MPRNAWHNGLAATPADLAWVTRYANRCRNEAPGELHDIVEGVAPRHVHRYGIDGGLYSAYIYDHPHDPLYMAVVDYPGYVDDLSFSRPPVGVSERGDRPIHAWVTDRMDRRPLPLHPSGANEPSRLERETVLAHLIAHPDQLGAVRDWLPADTFTSDLRAVFYENICRLADTGRAVNITSVAAGVDADLARLSPQYRSDILATSSPHAYLNRLALTPSDPARAVMSAYELINDDLALTARSISAAYHDTLAGPALRTRPVRLPDPSPQLHQITTTPDGQRLWPPHDHPLTHVPDEPSPRPHP